MTSASACRPRLVGRPRGIMPAPTASEVRAAWGLLADFHEPRSTAGSARRSPGLIDGRPAASSPSFRAADKNARTITRRGGGSRDRSPRTSRRLAKHPREAPSPLFSPLSRSSVDHTRERSLVSRSRGTIISAGFRVDSTGRLGARASLVARGPPVT